MNHPSCVHHPTLTSEEDKTPGTGLYCFLDSKRPCSSECMAHLAQAPEGPDYATEQQWPHCMLLVNAHRTGKHLVVLAATATDALKTVRTMAADQKRASPAPVPPIGNRG